MALEANRFKGKSFQKQIASKANQEEQPIDQV